MDYLPIQYLTTPIFTDVRVFRQQIGYKYCLKSEIREQISIDHFHKYIIKKPLDLSGFQIKAPSY